MAVLQTGAMAAPNPSGQGRPDEEAADRATALQDRLAIVPSTETVRALAFWSAVVLPFLHVPLLASGLGSTGEFHAFVTLLVLNAVALYAGHPHGHD
jgi:hypothetical protein